MKRNFKLLIPAVLLSEILSAQIGIKTINPTNTLDVNGTLRVRSLNQGIPYKGEKIVTVDSLGVFHASEKEDIIPSPTKVGSVISDGKKLIVAQEIAASMSADFVTSATGTPPIINTINKKIIDNEDTLNNGVFRVAVSGTYQVVINALLAHNRQFRPVIGLWNGSANRWIARINDAFMAPVNTGRQTYTLMTTVELSPNIDYSFRVYASTGTVTVKAQNEDNNDISYFSVKRIK